jgi:WhiB family redox-sensing transcriptional regulator
MGPRRRIIGVAKPHLHRRPQGRRELPAAFLISRPQIELTHTHTEHRTERSEQMLAERRENEEFDQGQDEAWLWANARCNDGTGNLVALFFSEQLDDIARAKAFCGGCPVQEACFEAALVRREPYGVWGGRLFFKGKVLAVKRPRGRPPKNPRPEVVVDSGAQSLIA